MIQVINRAFDILEMCARNPNKELSLSQIADKLGLNHGTCANIAKTLVERNYLEQIGYKKGYRLGKMAFQVTGNISVKSKLVELSKPVIDLFTEELNETCLIAILRASDYKRIVLYEAHSTHELTVRTIKEKDIANASTGRLMLAYMSDFEIDEYILKVGLPMPEIWPNTGSILNLKDQLAKIRKSGCAVQSTRNQIVGLAVPIFKDNEVIASLSFYMPEVRYKGTMKEIALNRLMAGAHEISNKLNTSNSSI